MGCHGVGFTMAFVVTLVLVAGGKGVSGQQAPSCAAKLVPCANYLNSTKPPESCCNPMREAVQNEKECLCNLYSNPEFFKSLGINITQAIELPKHCGITADVDLCSKTGGTPPSGKSNATAAPPPPSGKNNAYRGVTWIGFSSLMSLLLLWASVIV